METYEGETLGTFILSQEVCQAIILSYYNFAIFGEVFGDVR